MLRYFPKIAAAAWTACCLSAGPVAAQSIVTADALLRDASFKSTYFTALGPRAKTKWLATLDNSAPVSTVKVRGDEWQQVTPCKPHDCADNNLLLLWSPTKKVVHGKLVERGRSTFIGAPEPAIAAELERLWQKEFRQR